MQGLCDRRLSQNFVQDISKPLQNNALTPDEEGRRQLCEIQLLGQLGKNGGDK